VRVECEFNLRINTLHHHEVLMYHFNVEVGKVLYTLDLFAQYSPGRKELHMNGERVFSGSLGDCLGLTRGERRRD